MLFLNADDLNIKKLYQHAGKCDNQQQFKDIVEAAMVSSPEGFTNNSPRYPLLYIMFTIFTPTKKCQHDKSSCVVVSFVYVPKVYIPHYYYGVISI